MLGRIARTVSLMTGQKHTHTTIELYALVMVLPKVVHGRVTTVVHHVQETKALGLAIAFVVNQLYVIDHTKGLLPSFKPCVCHGTNSGTGMMMKQKQCSTHKTQVQTESANVR